MNDKSRISIVLLFSKSSSFFIKDDHYIILKVKKLILITQEIRAQQLRYTSTFYLNFKSDQM